MRIPTCASFGSASVKGGLRCGWLQRPKRFLTSQKDVDIKGNHFELMPFGSGRRMCPGVSFALQSLHITLASLLQQYVVKKPSDEPIDMSESFGLTNMKATPLEVLLTPRLPLGVYHFGT
ncbi:cytochrome P450 CYP82D47-like protein [Tanacetum coccineum]